MKDESKTATVEELREAQLDNIGECRSVNQRIKEEGRDYTPDELTEHQRRMALDAEFDQRIKSCEASLQLEKREEELKTVTRSVGPACYHTQYRQSEQDGKYLGECIRSWMLEGENNPSRDVERAADNYRINFTKPWFNLDVDWMVEQPKSRNEIRSSLGQKKGTTTLGGFTVPTLTEQLVRHIRWWAPLLDMVDLRQVSSGATDYIPYSDTSARRAVLTAEEGTRVKNDIIIARKQMDFYQYTSRCSDSLIHLEDSSTPMEQLILDVLGDDESQQISEVLTIGSGSGEPWGLVAAASAGVTGFDVTDWTDFQKMQSYVDPRYWPESSYFGGIGIFNSAAILEDTTHAPLGLFSGGTMPNRTWNGYPFTLLPAMSAMSASGSPRALLFGSAKALRVHIVNKVTFFKDEYSQGQDGIVNWSVRVRLGSVNMGPDYALVYATA